MTQDDRELLMREIELIVLRLETLPPNVYFYSGNGSKISRNDMIKHVEKHDEIGQEFIEIEMEFLRALKDGKLMRQIMQESPRSAQLS